MSNNTVEIAIKLQKDQFIQGIQQSVSALNKLAADAAIAVGQVSTDSTAALKAEKEAITTSQKAETEAITATKQLSTDKLVVLKAEKEAITANQKAEAEAITATKQLSTDKLVTLKAEKEAITANQKAEAEAITASKQLSADKLVVLKAEKEAITANLNMEKERILQIQRLQHAREVIGFTNPNTEREVVRLQAAYERLRASGTLTASELARAHLAMTKEIVAARNSAEGWAASFALVREQLIKLAVAGAGIGLAVREAIHFETAMAGVRKVVDFPTPKAFEEMVADIKSMSREIPLTVVGLARIAEAGGQMGIAAKEIRGFTELVAKMATSFSLTPEVAGDAVGKLINIFKMTIPETELLADAMTKLGNDTNAVERDILNVMNRVGGMAKMFGLANTETAALSATFLALGRPPEVAATSIDHMLQTLQTAPSREGEFKKALQRIGISAEQLAADIAKNPQKALITFLETLKSLDKQTLSESLVHIFGREYSANIAVLIGSLDKYKEIMGMVAKETQYAGLMQKQFTERSKITESQLQLAKNGLEEVAINLGNAFLPLIVGAAKGVAHLTQGLAALVDYLSSLSAATAVAIAAFSGVGALQVAVSALRVGMVALGDSIVVMGKASYAFMTTPLGAAMTAAGVAAYFLVRALSSSIPPLVEEAAALGKSRAATAEKIKTLEGLKKSLAETEPGTKEHIEAEQKLAAIIPIANVSLDNHGRLLAQVGKGTHDNSEKLKEYLALLKKNESKSLALQLGIQARAFVEAQKEMADYTDNLRNWYGIGTGEAVTATQKFWVALNGLTGTYDINMRKGAEFDRQLNDTEAALKETMEAARKSGLSVAEVGKALGGLKSDPNAMEQIIAFYRAITGAADDAGKKTGSLKDSFAQFSVAIRGSADVVKKDLVEAIHAADHQLTKIDETLNQHKEKLKQAVEEESHSWHTLVEAAASTTKATSEKIGEEYAQRHNRLEALLSAGLLSEKRNAELTITLAIQETQARVAEAQRYQAEALKLVKNEYQVKMENAKRFNQDSERVDADRLLAQKNVLVQTEVVYHQSIDKLVAEEKRLLDEAKRLAAEKVNLKRTVEEQLIALAEKTMNAGQKYAFEESRIAREQTLGEAALRAGNYDEAKQHFQKMRELAVQNSDEVKNGAQVIVSAQEAQARSMEQVRKSAELESKALDEQQKNNANGIISTQRQVEALTGKLRELRKEMDDTDQAIGRDHAIVLRLDREKVNAEIKIVDDMIEKRVRVVQIKAELQEAATFSGGIADKIKEGLTDQVKEGLDRVAQTFTKFKDEFVNWNPEVKEKLNLTSVGDALAGLTAKFDEFKGKIDPAGAPNTVKVDTSRAVTAIGELTAKINDLHALDGQVITLTVNQVTAGESSTDGLYNEGYSRGGPIGFDRGGQLAGYGGGDRIPALLEAGEFVIRKEAVRRYGAGMMAGLNAMRLDPAAILPRFASGGIINTLRIPTLPAIPAFAGGGMVSSVEVMRLDLTFGGRPAASITAPRDQVRGLVDALKELQRGLA